MNAAISQRQYEASGQGSSRAPVEGFVFFRVWRERGTGAWYQAHPTDPRGDDVLYTGEVSGVERMI